MEPIEKLLVSSGKLYSYLQEQPTDNQRESYIEQITVLLETREIDLQGIKGISKEELFQHSSASDLIELDKGIQESLERIMDLVKNDIRGFQVKRKTEASYSNPYAETQTIDGMYYDKKK